MSRSLATFLNNESVCRIEAWLQCLQHFALWFSLDILSRPHILGPVDRHDLLCFHMKDQRLRELWHFSSIKWLVCARKTDSFLRATMRCTLIRGVMVTKFSFEALGYVCDLGKVEVNEYRKQSQQPHLNIHPGVCLSGARRTDNLLFSSHPPP